MNRQRVDYLAEERAKQALELLAASRYAPTFGYPINDCEQWRGHPFSIGPKNSLSVTISWQSIRAWRACRSGFSSRSYGECSPAHRRLHRSRSTCVIAIQ